MQERSSISVFLAVYQALFLREVQTRFGNGIAGYFWVATDAMAPILIFALIHIYMLNGIDFGYDYSTFLASGFVAFNLFRNIVRSSIDSFSANQSLFAYKQVRPIDTVIVRYFIEIMIALLTILFLILLGTYLGVDMSIKNPVGVILGFIWISFFGLGLGMAFAVVGYFFETVKKVVVFLMTPLFFLSALFYTVGSLNVQMKGIILYNPVVHFIEFIHGSYFQILDTEYVDFGIMALWTLIPMWFGLWYYRRIEQRIIAS